MKIKIGMLIFLTMMIALPFAVQSVTAQDSKDKTKMDKKDDASKKKKQSFVLKAVKVEGERGEDQNVKDDSLLNNQNADFPAPKEKAGEANERGATGVCKVVLDNRTKWKIQIYVDGSFRGVMAPYGDSTAYTGAGPTRVYARAQFDDGSALNWGPSDYICYPGQYIHFRMDP